MPRGVRLTEKERLIRAELLEKGLKWCYRCDTVKPISEFRRCRPLADGLAYECTACKDQMHVARKRRDGITSSDLSGLRVECRKRGQEFSLSSREVIAWWKSEPDKCHYCGRSTEEYLETKELLANYNGPSRLAANIATLHQFGRMGKTNRLTIDRKDNEIGYVKGNLVKCCLICNLIKSGFLDEDEMLFVGPRLRRRLENALSGSSLQ